MTQQDEKLSPGIILAFVMILGSAWYFNSDCSAPKPKPAPDPINQKLTAEELSAVRFLALYAEGLSLAFDASKDLIPTSKATDFDVINFQENLAERSELARHSASDSTIHTILEEANQGSPLKVRNTSEAIAKGLRSSSNALYSFLNAQETK